MPRSQFLPILLSSFLILGCSNQKASDKSITVTKNGKNVSYEVHLKEVNESKQTQLTDLAKDFEFVELEANEESIFERGKFLITNNYILVQRRSHGILQFDRQGNFIRTLVKTGAGPREYRFVGWVVAENSQTLFLAENSKLSYLLRFNLESGEYLGDLQKAIPVSSSEIYLSENNNLIILARGTYEEGSKPFYAYEQDVQGVLIRKFDAPDDWINREVEKIGRSFNHNLWIQKRSENSLYIISKNQNSPYLTFDFGQLPQPGLVGDKRFEFDFAIGQKIYFNIFTVTFLQPEGESFISYGESECYFLDTKEGKAYVHESILLNPTHHKVDADDREFNVQSNGIIFYVYSAIDLIEQTEKALKDDEFQEPYRSLLTELKEKLSEDSNPVLLISK